MESLLHCPDAVLQSRPRPADGSTLLAMPSTSSGGATVVPRIAIRPFASFIILVCDALDVELTLNTLLSKIRNVAAGRRGSVTVVAAGLGDVSSLLRSSADDDRPGIDDLDALIYRYAKSPGWLKGDATFEDVRHELVVATRRSRLIGVHCDSAVRESLERWLVTDPRPPFRKVPPAVLHEAFLEGEIRGLWLRGTHARRTTKPDSENLTGRRLQDALNPFEHGSFAMGSARANLPDADDREVLTGPVGTTPRRSLIWARQTDTFETFVRLVGEALTLVERILAVGGGLERPFPELAARVDDIKSARGAFDLSAISPHDLAMDASDELREAAALLELTTLEVTGEAASPNFDIDVGFGGIGAGTLRMTVSQTREEVVLRLGTKVGQSFLGPDLPRIRAALEHTELLTVRYESGHAVADNTLFLTDVVDSTFRKWEWCSFAGYDIVQEKPCTCVRSPSGACRCDPQTIHNSIALNGDQSLFAWVVNRYSDGWLTCDDGSGEVADFVHVDIDGQLTLIHVKAAKSDSVSRGTAVGAYETVASQAIKNLRYVHGPHLLDRLKRPGVAQPACWIEGKRVPNRDDLCDIVGSRSRADETHVVIVQPHVSRTLYEKVKSAQVGGNLRADTCRLNLLEYLLNAARRTAIGLNSDLSVYASDGA